MEVNPPMTRRAMSLIEVLAATMLLALLGSALAGLVVDLARPRPDVNAVASAHRQLAAEADRIVADPAGIALVLAGGAAGGSVELAPGLRASRAGPAGDGAAWILFERDGVYIGRWAVGPQARGDAGR